MPDVMRIYCPIDGLQMGSKSMTIGQLNSMVDKSTRAHAVWNVSASVGCANGHQWGAVGSMEMRWDPSDPDYEPS